MKTILLSQQVIVKFVHLFLPPAPYIPMPPQLFHSGPTSTAISRVNFLLLPCLPFTLRHYFPILSLLNSLTFLITTVNLPPPPSSISLVYLVLSFHLDFSLSLTLSPRLGRRRSPDYCSVAFSKTGSKLHGHSSRANEPRIGRKARHATISTNSQREEERERRGEDKTRIGKVEGSVHCAAANEPRVPSRANLWRKCSNSHTTPCSRRNLPPSFSSSTSPRRRSRRRAKCHRFRPLLNRESRRGRGWKGRRRGKKTHTTAARLSAIRSVIIRNCSAVIDGRDRALLEIHIVSIFNIFHVDKEMEECDGISRE